MKKNKSNKDTPPRTMKGVSVATQLD